MQELNNENIKKDIQIKILIIYLENRQLTENPCDQRCPLLTGSKKRPECSDIRRMIFILTLGLSLTYSTY